MIITVTRDNKTEEVLRMKPSDTKLLAKTMTAVLRTKPETAAKIKESIFNSVVDNSEVDPSEAMEVITKIVKATKVV